MSERASSDNGAMIQYGADKAFLDYLSRGEFHLQQCGDCERYIFYPRMLCPHCGGVQLHWKKASGSGTVYATSVPRAGEHAYNIALVELSEGPRMMTRVIDIDPWAVTIGMPVTAFVGSIAENPGQPLVLFRPARG